MRKKRNYIAIFGVLILAISACVYPYNASISENLTSMLVVEGDIIVNGTTRINLSRTSPLDNAYSPVIQGAQVYVEDEQGGRYAVPEVFPGLYEAETSHLDWERSYRLHITLSNKSQYASAYVPVCVSPLVDSVGYIVNPDSTAIYVHLSTHDVKGKTQYYKWSYVENWEIMPQWMSMLTFDTETLRYRYRYNEENIHFCWTSRSSSEILLGNTTRLSDDVIADQTLFYISELDPRAQVLYSVQFAQAALTREAYSYWENLRKNSEDVGGLFSPQPSELNGNLYALNNPDEVVLGYVSAYAQTLSERAFIPGGLMRRPPWRDCDCRSVYPPLDTNDKVTPFVYFRDGLIPVDYSPDMSQVVWHRKICCDCQMHGGTKNKPAWWPNHHI